MRGTRRLRRRTMSIDALRRPWFAAVSAARSRWGAAAWPRRRAAACRRIAPSARFAVARRRRPATRRPGRGVPRRARTAGDRPDPAAARDLAGGDLRRSPLRVRRRRGALAGADPPGARARARAARRRGRRLRPHPGPAARSRPQPAAALAAAASGRRAGRRRQHAAAVAAVRPPIGRGDVYQVNVVGHAAARYTGDPLPALRRLAALPGARYGGVLTGDGWALGCASPETLVEVSGGQVITRPIKGTRPATAAGPRRAARLGQGTRRTRHDRRPGAQRPGPGGPHRLRHGSTSCSRCAAGATCGRPSRRSRARLADGLGLADLLRAVCPGGSVTGAPKLAALAEIARWSRSAAAPAWARSAGSARPGSTWA